MVEVGTRDGIYSQCVLLWKQVSHLQADSCAKLEQGYVLLTLVCKGHLFLKQILVEKFK